MGAETVDIEVFVGQGTRKPVEVELTYNWGQSADFEMLRYEDIRQWDQGVGDACLFAKTGTTLCMFLRDNIGIVLRSDITIDLPDPQPGEDRRPLLVEADKRRAIESAKPRKADLKNLADAIDALILKEPRIAPEALTDYLPVFKKCLPEQTRLVRGSDSQSVINSGKAPIGKTLIHLAADNPDGGAVSVVPEFPTRFEISFKDSAIEITYTGGQSGTYDLVLWAINESLLGTFKRMSFDVEFKEPEQLIELTESEFDEFIGQIKRDFDDNGKIISQDKLSRRFDAFRKVALEKRTQSK